MARIEAYFFFRDSRASCARHSFYDLRLSGPALKIGNQMEITL
jgi:hypothetical protein